MRWVPQRPYFVDCTLGGDLAASFVCDYLLKALDAVSGEGGAPSRSHCHSSSSPSGALHRGGCRIGLAPGCRCATRCGQALNWNWTFQIEVAYVSKRLWPRPCNVGFGNIQLATDIVRQYAALLGIAPI